MYYWHWQFFAWNLQTRGPDLHGDDSDDSSGGIDESGPSTSAADHRKEKTPQQVSAKLIKINNLHVQIQMQPCTDIAKPTSRAPWQSCSKPIFRLSISIFTFGTSREGAYFFLRNNWMFKTIHCPWSNKVHELIFHDYLSCVYWPNFFTYSCTWQAWLFEASQW